MNTAAIEAAAIASARIAEGEDPDGMVHILFYPADAGLEGIQGLSTALPAGSSLAGYTERYYTLGELAAHA